MTAEIAAAWKIEVSRHIVRKVDYKGKKADAAEQSLKFAFDGFSLPGLLYTAACRCSGVSKQQLQLCQ